MKKAAFVFIPLALLLAVSALMYGQANELVASPTPNELALPGKMMHRLEVRGERTLLLQTERPLPDSSPDNFAGEFFVATRSGKKQLIDTEVVSAKNLSDGELVYVADKTLKRVRVDGKSKMILATGVEADFAISPKGHEIAITRPTHEGDLVYAELSTIDTQGRALQSLVRGPGVIASPIYSPDEKYVVFVAAFDGVMSWYRVNTNGGQLTQLTNRGQIDIGPNHIPVPCRTDTIVFKDNQTIVYDSCEGIWQLDIVKAIATKLEV